jgi:hypothetical protein
MAGNEAASYKRFQRFLQDNDPREALKTLFNEEAEFIIADPTEIERLYSLTRPHWPDPGPDDTDPLPPNKRKSHSKDLSKETPVRVRQHLHCITGIDITAVDGLGLDLTQEIISEIGTDMNKFPTDKHFCSWLGLAPKHEISGGKVLNNKTLKTKNRAGQAFRMAAQSVKQAECAFGVLYRRLRARLGPAQATVATAHAIARVVYRMLKYKVEYDPLSVNEYQKQYEEQQIKYMKKRAAKLGYQLMPVPA